MRGIAREDDAAVAEFLEPPRLERIDAEPFEVEARVRAEHRLEARDHALGLPLEIVAEAASLATSVPPPAA